MVSKYWVGHIVDAHRQMAVDSLLAIYGFWTEVWGKYGPVN